MITATYSPEDNKIRLYPSERLSPELFARVVGAGFIRAPAQGLFVAPMWTPGREDLALELCGEIEDETMTLAERAEARAERFEGYSEKREAEAHAAHEAVQELAAGIPLGQPIIIAHHSERKARKAAERIENGMRRAVKLWDTAEYWERRANGALNHAEYKARPGVRARRIKGLEADARKQRKNLEASEVLTKLWTSIAALDDADLQRTKALRLLGAINHSYGLWSDLNSEKITGKEACERAIKEHAETIAYASRWLTHLTNRLAYERVFLGRAPDQETPRERKVGKSALPLLNYRHTVFTVPRLYGRGEAEEIAQIEMTKAEYAALHPECRGSRIINGSHRVRVASSHKIKFSAVFLTDSKEHPVPQPKAVAA